jgi:hypothetical protein
MSCAYKIDCINVGMFLYWVSMCFPFFSKVGFCFHMMSFFNIFLFFAQCTNDFKWMFMHCHLVPSLQVFCNSICAWLRFPLFLNKIICCFFSPHPFYTKKYKYNVSLLNMKVITIDYHIFCIMLDCHFFQSLILTVYELIIIFEKKWSIGLFNFVYVDV